MHVALVHDHVGGAGGGGGGVRQMLELAQGLLAKDCRVTVVCHSYDPDTDLAGIGEQVDVRAVETGPVQALVGQRMVWRRQFSGMRRVAALVPADVDVINAHEWPALHAGRLAARRTGAPMVWTRNDETMFERGLFPDETTIHPGSVTSRLRHLLYGVPDYRDARSAAAIVVLDGRNALGVKRAYREDAIVVRSGPAPRFFDAPDQRIARERLGLMEDERLALAVGIMFPHRRFEDLVDAIAQLGGTPAWSARIVGWDGFDPVYADRLEERIREREVAGQVQLVRRSVSDEELRDLYAAADLFVFANRRQTWGLAPLEALASGTPVIVSRGAGVHEVLDGRPGAWIVPAERPDAIAEGLRRAADGALDRDLEETRRWIRDELNEERYAESMLDVFRAVAR